MYESLKDYPDVLVHKFSETNISVLKVELLSSSSESFHLAIYNEELLKEFTFHDNFGDATFSICPDVKGVHQIFIVMGKKYFTVGF